MEEGYKEKVDEIFGNLTGDDTVAILIHPSPDPDCLGAAAGFSVLLKETYGLNSRTFHLGEISHPQNKSIKNVLRISLEDGRDFEPSNFSATVVLDTDLHGTGFKNDKFQEADVRIDHHVTDRNGARFKDVRVVGSTCSIVWDYLKTFDVDLSEYKDEATAMVLGIKTDTLDFTRADTSDLDLEAYRSLLPFVDKNSLAKVIKYPLPKVQFEIEAKAFKDKEVRGTTLISFVGEITAHNRDIIPTIADRFSRIDGVSTAVIMGLIENKIVVSVRSEDARVDVYDLCVGAFGKKNAGGKDGSGGATFNLGPAFELITDKETKEKVRTEVVSQLTEKIFEALGEHKQEEK